MYQSTGTAQPSYSPANTADPYGSNSKTYTNITTTTSNVSPRSSTHRGFARVLRFWRKEVASYVLAFLALFAVIFILVQSNNKPVQHQSGPFTTNSLVSIFTAIFKSAMLMPIAEGISELKWLWFEHARPVTDVDRFDLASRGPRGSLQFLFRLPSNKLASLGAFITIIALGIDPFTQQVIQFSDCPWPADGPATVSRTNNYTAYSSVILEGPPNIAGFMIDGQALAALYMGTMSPPTNSTSSKFYSCPSGICDFTSNHAFSTSLAVCFSVEDITISITKDNSTYNPYYNLPSGLRTNQPVPGNAFIAGMTTRSGSSEDSPYYELEALAFTVNGNSSVQIQVGEYGLWAFRASLYPCIQTYQNVIISSGQLAQTVMSTTRLPWINTTAPYYSLAGNFSAFAGIDCSPAVIAGGSKTQATHRLRSGKDYAVPRSSSEHVDSTDDTHVAASQDILWYDPACVYEFGSGPTFATIAQLQNMFGYLGEYNSSYYPSYLYGLGSTATNIKVEPDGGPWLQVLFANGNSNMASVTGYFEGIANAVTATMQTTGDTTNSRPLEGQAMTMRSCVRVEWFWLTLNIVLFLSTAVFLVMSIWRAKKAVNPGNNLDGRGSWKSSSLPLLWCGLEDSSRENNGLLDELDRMEERSDLLEVKLVKLPGWATVECEVPPEELEQSYAMSRATGRWVLQEQRQLTTPNQEPRLRRWGIRWGGHVPI